MEEVYEAYKDLVSEMQICEACGKKGHYRCGDCQTAFYCSRKCQREDWRHHKEHCFFIQANERIEAMKKSYVLKCIIYAFSKKYRYCMSDGNTETTICAACYPEGRIYVYFVAMDRKEVERKRNSEDLKKGMLCTWICAETQIYEVSSVRIMNSEKSRRVGRKRISSFRMVPTSLHPFILRANFQ